MSKSGVYDLQMQIESRDEGSPELFEAIPTELVKGDSVLYRQGDAPVEFSIIRHGKLKVSKQAPDGTRSVLEILGPGEPAGAMAVINNFDYPATVKAIEDCIVYRIADNLIPTIQDEAPTWWAECLGKAANRILDLADRLESIKTQDVDERLAKQLCNLAEEYGERRNSEIVLNTKLTRQMLADMVGCRIESAIRAMSVWEKKGVISTEQSMITLKHPENLHSIAGKNVPRDF